MTKSDKKCDKIIFSIRNIFYIHSYNDMGMSSIELSQFQSSTENETFNRSRLKPVFHYPIIVAVVDRWSFFRGRLYSFSVPPKTVRYNRELVIAENLYVVN